MHCTYCGKPLEPNARFCTGCGAAVPQQTTDKVYEQPTYQQPYAPAQPYVPVPANMSWKDFYNRFVTKKGFVTWMAVICFFSSALSLVLFALLEDPILFLDIAIFVPMGILLLTTKHWVFALIPTIYAAIGTIISLASSGTPSGIVALVVGVSATGALFNANKAFRQYKLDGTLPQKPL